MRHPAIIIPLLLSLAHFAYAGEKAPFTARICETLRIESSLYPGTAEFDSKALASLQAMGERPKILETLFARGDRCDESFSLRAVHSHMFFGWEGSEGDQIIYVTLQIKLDGNLRPVSMISSVKKEKLPPEDPSVPIRLPENRPNQRLQGTPESVPSSSAGPEARRP